MREILEILWISITVEDDVFSLTMVYKSTSEDVMTPMDHDAASEHLCSPSQQRIDAVTMYSLVVA